MFSGESGIDDKDLVTNFNLFSEKMTYLLEYAKNEIKNKNFVQEYQNSKEKLLPWEKHPYEEYAVLLEKTQASFDKYREMIKKDKSFNPLRYEAMDRMLYKTLNNEMDKDTIDDFHDMTVAEFKEECKCNHLPDIIETMYSVQSGLNNSTQYSNLCHAVEDLRDSMEKLKGNDKDDLDGILKGIEKVKGNDKDDLDGILKGIEKVKRRINEYKGHCDRHHVEETSRGYKSRAKKLHMTEMLDKYIDGIKADVTAIKNNKYMLEEKPLDKINDTDYQLDFFKKHYNVKREYETYTFYEEKVDISKQDYSEPFGPEREVSLKIYSGYEDNNLKNNQLMEKMAQLSKKNCTLEQKVIKEGIEAQKNLIVSMGQISNVKKFGTIFMVKNLKKVIIAKSFMENPDNHIFDSFRKNNADIPSLMEKLSRETILFENEEIRKFKKAYSKLNNDKYINDRTLKYGTIKDVLKSAHEHAEIDLLNYKKLEANKQEEIVTSL